DESMSYREKGYLVGAERKGEKVEGFDFGNSPFSFMNEKIKGAKIAITTTNGTRAIRASIKADKLVVGSFANLKALTDWLKKQNQNVLCVCSGWKNSFNLEDTLFAGALAYHLQEDFGLSYHRDSVLAAKHLYLISRQDLVGFLKNSSHYLRLHNLQIDKDIDFCLTANQTNVIPILKDGVLYEISKLEKANASY
ncbi:MAG: 2-phosphosulfolactate phosphatase, partial [Bacteroidia bacterium]|nr:2-phosphosulfolactate phosphatase [Bacteroidia bacterium]NNM15777.1 2-phosphosulfolactate phosphatase [Bacteroidia bacterium]